MYVWPVPQWNPSYSYHERPRSFGASRDGGKRKHAGCDLYAPEGSPVLAIWHGTVRSVYEFYGKADAIEVDHGALGVVRYGELIADDSIGAGQVVEAGAMLGKVAKLAGMGNIHPMLHLEMFSGKGSGKLTQTGNAYRRRSDLVDPTAFLDRLRLMHYAATWNIA